MNYKIRKLEDDIIATLNSSDAPMEAKRLILENVLNLINKEADSIIKFEIKKQREESKNGSLCKDELAEHAQH